MKNYILLLCTIIVSVYATELYAQTNFKSGFVIQQSGDTLRGEIDYRGDLLMGEVCRFKVNDIVQEFKPEDIRAYRFQDGKFYVSKFVNNKSVFLEYLVNGELDIYYVRDNEGDHYYAENAMLDIREIPYSEGLKSRNGKDYQYRSQTHVPFLHYYTDAAEDFAPRIAKIKKPTHRNLSKLAEDYHKEVCNSIDDCIVYERETPVLKIDLELLGGAMTVFDNAESGQYFSKYQAGLLFHVNMPRVNEKIYFRTGLLFSTVDFSDEHTTIYKIPAQFEYIYPKGIIRPKAFYGVNIYRPLFVSVAAGGGVNVAMHKSMAFSFTYEIDFMHNETVFLVPSSRLTQVISGGFIFKL